MGHYGYTYIKCALLSELSSLFVSNSYFRTLSPAVFFCNDTEASAVTHFAASAGIALLSHPWLQC